MNKVMHSAIVSAVIVFMGTVGQRAEAAESLPEGLRGFSGQVRGVVAAKGEKSTFTFKVGRVLRVWKNNKAKTPEALVGRTVPVGPRWIRGASGKWHPVERQVAFIRKLEAGQEITLEIRNAERSHFNILELSAEQRQSARGGDAKGGRQAERKAEAEIQELKKEVQRLREEVAELRRLVKEKND